MVSLTEVGGSTEVVSSIEEASSTEMQAIQYKEASPSNGAQQLSIVSTNKHTYRLYEIHYPFCQSNRW